MEEYVNRQELKHRRKIVAVIEHLSREGPDLRRPYADAVAGPIRELRIGLGRLEHRIFYAFVPDRAILLLNAFAKKTDEAPRRELDVAMQRLQEINGRRAAGEVLE